MLVDTDPVYRAGVRARLEAVGFTVAEAADASDAVRVARELQPEVCLVDISGSVEALAAVPAIRTAAPQAKLVVLADDSDRAAAFAALRLGVLGYVERRRGDDETLVQTIEAVRRGCLALPSRLMDALIDVLAPGRKRRLAGERAVLTRRETEVARLLWEGRSTAEIAAELAIAPGTVRRHASSLASKLGVRGRAEMLDKLRGHPLQ
jgi:DNA-binding NarL/FixJ family response regulator